MKRAEPAGADLLEKMDQARQLCLARLRGLPKEKRLAVAEAILALAEPQWWERRQKGAEVFSLLLEMRQAEITKIMQDASR